MKIFYDSRQSVPANPSISPSAGKPAKVVQDWQERKFPLEILKVKPCEPADLYLAHDKQYVNDILSCRIENGFLNRLQTIADSLRWTNGSFVTAAEYAARKKESVVSPTSGFHHAEWNQALGFCTFNGLMIAAIHLKAIGLVDRVAILDIDMHYGNGTDNICEKLGIDYVSHYTFGGDLYTGFNFIEALPQIVEKTIQNCEVIFYQAGADPHVDDPYGGALTTHELQERDRIVFTLAKQSGIPVVWNLAGGYQQDFSKVLEIHRNTALMHLKVFEDWSP